MNMVPLSLPKCSCSDRSRDGQVFTCPECIRAAIRFWDGEGVDQLELFAQVDSIGSVSALSRAGGQLVHISEIVESVIPDGLPF